MSDFRAIFQTVVKIVLFLFNLIFLILGIFILAVGILLRVELHEYLSDFPVDISAITTVMMVIGCIVIFISFCGCWGPIKEIRWLLIMYAVIMLILAILKMIFVAILLGKMDSTKQMLSDWVTETFQDDIYADNLPAIETVLQCCGSSGPDSYEGKLPQLPPTCCPQIQDVDPNDYDPSNYEECTIEDAFKVGCGDALSDYFMDLVYSAGNTVIGIIVVEAVATSMALYMIHEINQKRYRAKAVA